MKTLLLLALAATITTTQAQHSTPQVIINYDSGNLVYTFAQDNLKDLLNGMQSLNEIPNSISSFDLVIATFNPSGDSINYVRTIKPLTNHNIIKDQYWSIAVSTILSIIGDDLMNEPELLKYKSAITEYEQILQAYDAHCLINH